MNSTSKPYERLVMAICLLLLIAIIGAIIVLSAIPPLSRDALTHHLFVPKLYLKNGGMVEIPWVEFSYFPMNLDLLYLIPLAFGNDIVPKYIHFGFAILTSFLIFYQLNSWFRPVYAWIGAVVFLAIPIIVKLSISVYVDLGLIFFSTLSLISLIAWMNKTVPLKYLVLSAVGAGLALGTKYNGLVVYVLIAFAVPWAYRQSQHSKKGNRKIVGSDEAQKFIAFKYLVLHGSIAVLLFSPWAIRNVCWTGNPLYPLYDSFFSKLQPEVSTDEKRQLRQIREIYRHEKPLNHFIIRRMIYRENWWEIASAPVRVFFQGQDDSPIYFDGKLNAILFFLPFFAFWRLPADRLHLLSAMRLLAGFSVLYILFVFVSTDLRVRYIAPVIPPLVILSVCGLHNITEKVRERRKTNCIPIFLIIMFISSIFIPTAQYLIELNRKYFPLAYISHRIERDDYIEHFWPEYAALQFANENLNENARILSVFGGNRGYYSDRKIFFNIPLFKELIVNSHSAEDIIRSLADMRFTHIMINQKMFTEWILPNLNIKQRQKVTSLFQTHLKLLFQKNAHLLFAI